MQIKQYIYKVTCSQLKKKVDRANSSNNYVKEPVLKDTIQLFFDEILLTPSYVRNSHHAVMTHD